MFKLAVIYTIIYRSFFGSFEIAICPGVVRGGLKSGTVKRVLLVAAFPAATARKNVTNSVFKLWETVAGWAAEVLGSRSRHRSRSPGRPFFIPQTNEIHYDSSRASPARRKKERRHFIY